MRRMVFLLTWCGVLACNGRSGHPGEPISVAPILPAASEAEKVDSAAMRYWMVLPVDVSMGSYLEVIDSLVGIARMNGDSIDEYILVHANPWIIDSLRATDYYTLMEHGRFVRDPRTLVVLRAGDSLGVPDSLHTARIRRDLAAVTIDVNIPAFRIRVVQGSDTVVDGPVRIGKNTRRYLKLAGHQVDLKTPTGEGEIVRVAKDPLFMDPRTGHRYKGTYRDDGKYTLLPVIPWLEPSINGLRPGTLIHPTTNRATLGKAASNGCVGTQEDDAWSIYYYAPLGTHVRFRYDTIEVHNGDTLRYDDVYGIGQGK